MKVYSPIRAQGGIGLTMPALLGGLILAGPPPSAASIGDAVDAPALAWTSGGSANWFSQATTSHDGTDAAESGPIANLQESWIETSVTGPGTLVFWWKVSSEFDDIENEGYDSIEFFTNGVSPFTGITGDVDWQLRSLELPGGTTVLRWSYIKDGSDLFPVGRDRAWLDQVSFFTSPFAPIISVQPEDGSAPLGATLSLTVQVVGTPPLYYQWRRDGTNLVPDGNLSGTQSPTLTLFSVSAGDLHRDYSVVITNAQGSVVSRIATVFLAPTLAQAVDTLGLVWATGGDSDWFGQTNVTHDATDAAQAGPVDDNEDHNEVSWIETTVVGPGELSFWWKVSSEETYDKLQFLTNGAQDLVISGDSGWQRVTRLFNEGPHTLRWQYSKDSIDSFRADTAWLDQVSFAPPPPKPFTLVAGGFNGGLFQITLQGQPDRSYRLYSSSNLLDWQPVQTNADPSGVVSFSDDAATGPGERFYRAETDSN